VGRKLNLRRGAGSGINSYFSCIIKRIISFQDSRDRGWWQMEKINPAGDDRGSQEITCRTTNSTSNGCFCVKKVDAERNRQENEKKCQIEKLFPFSFHIITINSTDTIN
jgi:hypothetical protein